MQKRHLRKFFKTLVSPLGIRISEQRIMSSLEPTEAEEHKPLSPAKQGKVRQKPQPGRNLDAAKDND